MSDRLLKESDVLRAVDNRIKELSLDPQFIQKHGIIDVMGVKKYILAIPSANRPQGEWIYGEHDVAMCDGYRCDRCGFFVPWDYEHKSIDFINDYHFCPYCGARIKGADDEIS